jgi:glycosyltransferase involved in cell wall biosynthesis
VTPDLSIPLNDSLSAHRRVMFVVPTAYDALVEKGVDGMILDRDEGGYFSRVVTIHPFTAQNREINLNSVHRIIEFGRPNSVARGMPRFAQLPGLAIHLLSLVWRIARIARQEKVEIIRANDPYFAGLIGWAASVFVPGARLCVSIHADYDKRFELDGAAGAPVIFGSRRLAKILEQFVLRRAELVLPIRDQLGDMARDAGVPTTRIKVIPHGIDFEPFLADAAADFRSRYDIEADAKILGFAGRLTRENYLDDIIDLAKSLAAKRDDFVVVLAGDGPERERFERCVNESAALNGRVQFTGFIAQADAFALRRESALGLCLMAGYSLIEACAGGRPVVAYDVEWHGELVINGETGALIAEGNVPALVKAVTDILDDPTKADAMGKAARTLAFSRHSLEAARLAKIEAYELLATDPH